MAHFGFPFRIDRQGRTASASDEAHVRELIEQVLFTAPGERPNRSDFGTGIEQLVFAPNSTELASAVSFMVQGALQQHLGHLIQVQEVEVSAEDSSLLVTVVWLLNRTQERRAATFERRTA